ncbi:MAG: carboxypeptidase-like regulatory domain-containing protein [Candidatus Aminicenantes bacterium]|nr:carboxypeptidase-like regulatory domain-containing protein [Candidatus Aminicenantes bacterium]
MIYQTISVRQLLMKQSIKLSAVILVCGMIPLTACASNKEAPFVIKNEKFAASDVCAGEGAYELRMEKGNLMVRALEDIRVKMLKDGLPSPWCHGLTHVFLGQVQYAGYVFNSSSADPLQFVVDRDKGYYYKQGTGEVTTPEGKIVALPSLKGKRDPEPRVASDKFALGEIKGLLVDRNTGQAIRGVNLFRDYLATETEADRAKIDEYMNKAEVETDDRGGFHFKGVPPGHFRLLTKELGIVGPEIIVSPGQTVDLGIIEIQK